MLFREDMEPSCSYCRHGQQISETHVACIKQGVMPLSHHCRKFTYDPLKRKPAHPKKLSTAGLTESDFQL